jgi:PadR family transcriptional regulator
MDVCMANLRDVQSACTASAIPFGHQRRGALPLHFDRSGRTLLSKRKGKRMSDGKIDLPQGTLELLVLKTLALGAQHGWAISERITQVSHDALHVRQGSLYPALHRMERQGWIGAKWRATENNRRAKYYELTVKGRRRLDATIDEWRRLTAAVELVLGSA